MGQLFLALTLRPVGPDKLNFDRYADAFARLLLNTETKTPLTIGIYGAWGMGKSFLMKKIREKMEEYLAKDRKKSIKTFVPWFHRSKKYTTRPTSDEIDFHFVEFNAWVYSGSETLWAGFVTHLYSEIEKYLGELVAFSFRLGKSFRRSLYNTSVLLICFGVLGFGLSLLLDFEKIEDNWSALQIAINSFWATAIGGSALVGLRALISAIRDLSESVAFSRALQLRKLSSKHDFQEQIGFMADIKDEISNISQLLRACLKRESCRVKRQKFGLSI